AVHRHHGRNEGTACRQLHVLDRREGRERRGGRGADLHDRQGRRHQLGAERHHSHHRWHERPVRERHPDPQLTRAGPTPAFTAIFFDFTRSFQCFAHCPPLFRGFAISKLAWTSSATTCRTSTRSRSRRAA